MLELLATNQQNKFFSGLFLLAALSKLSLKTGIKIALACGFFLAASTTSYASDLLSMLEKMSAASQSRNYQGTFILRKSNQISTLRVSHGKDERGVWESLEALNGEPRRVILQNKKVISIFPAKKLLTIRQSDATTSLKHKLPDNLAKLTKYYTFHQLHSDRIAGYKTFVLDLEPKDQYRYGYRYWLENDTGMLLRCDILNAKHSVIEQMMFTQMHYLDKPPIAAFKNINLKGYTVQKLGDETKPVNAVNWRVTKPPAGFKYIRSHYRKSLSLPALLQLVYSDGLASVSVFIEKLNDKTVHLAGSSALGAIHAYGVQYGDHYITSVGEVPAITVMQMAQTTKQVNSLKQAINTRKQAGQ